MTDIIKRLEADAEYHAQVAGDCDCRPEDTVNWQHRKNCLEAAIEIKRLRADNALLRVDVSRSSYHCD